MKVSEFAKAMSVIDEALGRLFRPIPETVSYAELAEQTNTLIRLGATAKLPVFLNPSSFPPSKSPGGTFTNIGGTRIANENIKRTGVVKVNHLWWWMNNINGCCVCKTKTPANMPWYKPFKQVMVKGLLREDFPYKDRKVSPRYNAPMSAGYSIMGIDYEFIVCSPECEQYIYLALLDT